MPRSIRRPLDAYMTAPWQVAALIDNLPELKQGGSVWCPCVGDGSLMRALQHYAPRLGLYTTSDINKKRKADFHGDATNEDHWWAMVDATEDIPNWVIENFPFNVEHLILPHAVQIARKGVVAMARVSFTEPTRNRGPWLKDHPYQKRITLERHSFTGNGKTDSATTDWLIWAKQPLQGPFGISAYGYRP